MHGVSPKCACQGFSLIEILIALTISTLTLSVFANLGSSWGNTAAVTQAQGALHRAYATAKSIALQNPQAQSAGNPAAIVCFTPTKISVYSGGTCSGTANWQTQWPSKVILGMGTHPSYVTPLCLGLSNAGILITSTSVLPTCAKTLTYKLSADKVTIDEQSLY